MRRRLLAVLSVGAMVAALAAGVAPASGAGGLAPRLRNLDPGGPARFSEKVPVNLVFVGYERDQVSNRLLYGVTERLGISYTYDYQVTYAGSGYERKFFSTLSRLAKPAPLTELQQQYNDQVHNALEVTGNHHIDAPTVERWLALHPPAGVDTRQNTIFFVNWYGQPNFKFHVYTKTDEPEPDTGFNFGAETESRKLIAWGGTTVDDADLDGRRRARLPHAADLGVHQERLPGPRGPVRRPEQGGPLRRHQPPVHQLFTSSPSYSPELTRPTCRTRSTSTPTPTRPSPGSTPPSGSSSRGCCCRSCRSSSRPPASATTTRTCPSPARPSSATTCGSPPRTPPATPTSTTPPSPTCSCSTRCT